MKDRIFTKIKLEELGECNVLNITFEHYFRAHLKSKGDKDLMVKYIILEILEVDGKKISEDILNHLEFNDIMIIMETVNAMTNNDIQKELQ